MRLFGFTTGSDHIANALIASPFPGRQGVAVAPPAHHSGLGLADLLYGTRLRATLRRNVSEASLPTVMEAMLSMSDSMQPFRAPVTSQLIVALLGISGMSSEVQRFTEFATHGAPMQTACLFAWASEQQRLIDENSPSKMARQHVLAAVLPKGHKLYSISLNDLADRLAEVGNVPELSGLPTAYSYVLDAMYSLTVSSRRFGTGDEPGLAAVAQVGRIG